MNKVYFLVFILIFGGAWNTFAQDEIYDEPIRIIDTLQESNSQKTSISHVNAKKSKRQMEKERYDALTAMEKKKEKLNRLRLGGNVGFQFGSYTYINFSPTAGYMVLKDRLELGAGPILIYQRYRYSQSYVYRSFVYGADAYARGFLYKGLYLEARYDPVNKPSYFTLDKRLWVHHLLLGAGYAATISKFGVFNISLLYNVLDNNESIYQGTFSDKVPLIVTMGVGFGIGGK